MATFQGTGGTVTVDNTSGAVTFSGATFASDGYTITGQPLTTTTAATPISVGTGLTATIAAAIQGSGGVDKTGAGTLVLSGTNTYTAGTTITAGTLQLGNGGATGSVVGDIVNNAALVFNRSDALTYGGVVSGAGALTQAGPGTLILTGNNTYTGGTTITAGTLQIGTAARRAASPATSSTTARSSLQPQRRGHASPAW